MDFEKRDWVPHSGWPIKKTDLDPFYARAQQVLDLGPYEYDVKYWQEKDPERKSLLPEDNPVVRNKVWQFSPPTRFGKKYGDAVKKSTNIHLYTYAHVTEIGANENVTSIEKLTVRNFAGKTHTVKAKRYILACNTIQNARLLLAACPQAPKGLGNDHDLVGRFFMEHLEVQSAWLHLPGSRAPEALPGRRPRQHPHALRARHPTRNAGQISDAQWHLLLRSVGTGKRHDTPDQNVEQRRPA